jgi:predicted Zn-dependent protease
VYWQNAEEGLEAGLPTKALIALEKLSDNYPEFIPGHIKFAEAAIRWNQPERAIPTLDRAYGIYPDRVDLLEPLLKLLISKKMEVEASIAARQFALNYPEHPDSPKYKKLADDYMNQFINDFKNESFVTALISGDRKIMEQIFKGESGFGEESAKEIKENAVLVTDPKLTEYINNLGQKLAKLSGRDDFKYEFAVLQDNSLNAFALPGGKIFINTGAIADMESEAELAGILSHEIAHTVFSHSYQKIVTETKARALRKVGLINTFFEYLKPELAFGRSLEQQADFLGTRILSSAGYSADGLYRVFDRWRNYEKNKQTGWLDSHPASSERVRYLQAVVQNRNYNRYSLENIEALITARGAFCKAEVKEQPTATPTTTNPSNRQTLGKVPVTAGQTNDNVSININGGKVESSGRYILNVEIVNKSGQSFGFVPIFAKTTNAEGKTVSSQFISASGKNVVNAGETAKGTLSVFQQPWRDTGDQGLVWQVTESTGGGRVFRIPF